MCQAPCSVFFLFFFMSSQAGLYLLTLTDKETDPQRFNQFSQVMVSAGVQTLFQICFILKTPIQVRVKG